MRDEPVRVNTRISKNHNDWLDERSLLTSVSKSALINMAIENYIRETEVVAALPELMDKISRLEEIVKKHGHEL